MKIHHASSINEAINDFQEFLESDLYTKFRPEIIIPTRKKEKFYREDIFPNEKEFLEYLNDHFNILRREIIRIIGKRELNKVRRRR